MTVPFCQQPDLLMQYLDIWRFEIITCMSAYKKVHLCIELVLDSERSKSEASWRRNVSASETVPSKNNNSNSNQGAGNCIGLKK